MKEGSFAVWLAPDTLPDTTFVAVSLKVREARDNVRQRDAPRFPRLLAMSSRRRPKLAQLYSLEVSALASMCRGAQANALVAIQHWS